VKTVVDGRTFDSKREAARYEALRGDQRAGRISGLRLQVRIPLKAGGVIVARYVADFVYVRGGRQVIEDCKGMRTAMYRLKRKWIKAQYGIEILET